MTRPKKLSIPRFSYSDENFEYVLSPIINRIEGNVRAMNTIILSYEGVLSKHDLAILRAVRDNLEKQSELLRNFKPVI